MDILKDVNTVISIVAGIGSIIMFFLSRHQKNKCLAIQNKIELIFNKNSTITSQDSFNIENVGKLDNRKSVK
ncbi:MAG: hypothetical protein LKI17_06470 [Megasphaera cerevisiae]|jgi:hypothetical protein|nr:hypothetical protein [Megasphaera cerevisiae]